MEWNTWKKESPQEEVSESKHIEETMASPDKDPIRVTMSITRPKDFYFPKMEEVPLYFSSHSPWESFPAAMVISGGGFNKCNVGSMKRRFE